MKHDFLKFASRLLKLLRETYSDKISLQATTNNTKIINFRQLP